MESQTDVAPPARFHQLPIADLVESPLNPRQHFDEKKLDELAASIRGVGIIEPLVVRAVNGTHEIVAGGRRYRAAKRAQLAEVPVVIRTLTDAEALEIMVIENNQREDVNPLEEASGYAALMQADTRYRDRAVLAAKIGRSASYVHQRLKLLELVAAAQKVLLAGEITAGHAILLARLEPKDQYEALKACFSNGYGELRRGDDKHPMSVRQLARWIDEHVHLDLQAAPFRKDDPALVPKAGPCTTCPKRVGSNPALFEDLKKKGDTCTDPTCYQAKLTAFTARRVEEATSSVGSEVVRISDRAYVYGADEKRLKDAGVLVKAEYTPGAGTWKPADSKICPHFKVAIVVDAENPSSLGQRKEVCASPQACAVHTDKIDRDIARANTQSDQRDKAKKQKVVRERKVRESILTAVRDKVTELATEDLRFVAISFVEEMHADRQKQTYRLMAWSEPTKEKKAFGGTFSDFKKALQRELGQASPELLARFLVTAALTRAAEVHEHWPTDPKPLYEAAKRWKVDADAIRWGFDAVDRAVTAKAKDKAGKAKKASKAAGVQTSARGGKPAKPPTVKRTKAKAVKRTKGRDV